MNFMEEEEVPKRADVKARKPQWKDKVPVLSPISSLHHLEFFFGVWLCFGVFAYGNEGDWELFQS